MAQQTKRHEEQIDFLARRTKALQEIEKVSKVSYDDKKRYKNTPAKSKWAKTTTRTQRKSRAFRKYQTIC